MKNKLSKVMKTILLSAVAVAVVAVGSFSSSVGAYATETTIPATPAVESESAESGVSGVKYVQYSDGGDYISYCFQNKVAPEYAGVDADGVGYLFGGWYNKNGNTYTAIKDKTGLDAATTVVAKFVSAQTLSVKCQNWAGTTAESNQVIVRVLSAVDSTNYSNYGFEVSKIVGGVEKTLGTYKSTDSNEVYSKFNYYEKEINSETDEEENVLVGSYEPSDLFGDAAKYFTTCTVGYITTAEHGTIFCIKPFWITLDGTTVYGLSKFAHVEDGYLGYVNVPVNLNILNADNGAAAGILTVKSNNAGLTFLGEEEGVECGKVFDEMEFNVTTDSEGNTIIKCVGNTSDISDMKEMDIYINLRFQRTDTTTAPVGDCYTFSVTEEEFCNSSEKFLEADDVWNIKY